MHESCLHKIGPNKSDKAIVPKLQNTKFEPLFRYHEYLGILFKYKEY